LKINQNLDDFHGTAMLSNIAATTFSGVFSSASAS